MIPIGRPEAYTNKCYGKLTLFYNSYSLGGRGIFGIGERAFDQLKLREVFSIHSRGTLKVFDNSSFFDNGNQYSGYDTNQTKPAALTASLSPVQTNAPPQEIIGTAAELCPKRARSAISHKHGSQSASMLRVLNSWAGNSIH